jgi:hypothetical protein
LPGAGNGSCVIAVGATLGVCRNPISCTPQANTCRFNGDECGGSNLPSNCCGEIGPGVCELDALGVPRCNGLDGCRAAGEPCASSADCCDGKVCAPAANQTRVCTAQDCRAADETCSANSDCCAGTQCNQLLGSSSGTCGAPPQGGSLGCALYGQQCDQLTCCSAVPCTNGRCIYPPQ